MSVLAWWAIPVIATLLAGLVAAWHGRTPRSNRTSRDVEGFVRFRTALERQLGDGSRPR